MRRLTRLGLLLVLSALMTVSFMVSRVAPDTMLTVLTMNCGDGSNWDANGTESILHILDVCVMPDLVFIQEPMKYIKEIANRFAYAHVIKSGEKHWYSHPIVLTNYDVLSTSFLFLNEDDHQHGFATCAALEHEGHSYFVCSVHLDTAYLQERGEDQSIDLSWKDTLSLVWSEVFDDTIRYQEMLKLLDVISTRNEEYVILGGDFNTIFLAKGIRELNQVLDDALWPSLAYFQGTHAKIHFPITPRIDYIFHSPQLECWDAEVIPISPGDHYPVYAQFILPPPMPKPMGEPVQDEPVQ